MPFECLDNTPISRFQASHDCPLVAHMARTGCHRQRCRFSGDGGGIGPELTMKIKASSVSSAFTLVELLVAMAVLGLLMVLFVQLINSTSTVVAAGGKRMDADSQARLLFDRMAVDFGKIVRRPDVDYYFAKNAGNDQMAFYSEASGYAPAGAAATAQPSGVSLVGYRINDKYQLERLGKSLVNSDNANSMVFNPAPGSLVATWPGIADGSDANYQVVADQVYRLEYNFLLKPYTDASTGPQPSILSTTPWDTRQSHTLANGLSDVSAIVVAVAILDNTSRKIVPDNKYADMVGDLPDASASSSILETWNGSNYLTSSGIPGPAAANIRIYQRMFYLNPTP